MLAAGGYNSVKLYIFNKINSYLTQKIEYKNLEFGLFPLSVNIRDIKEFVIKDKNIVSFKRVSAEIPLFSLFSKEKEVNITIHEPKINLDSSLLKGKKKKSSKSLFKVTKVNIRNGEIVFNAKGLQVSMLKFNLLSLPRKDGFTYRLATPHLKMMFYFSGRDVVLQGQMLSEFRELDKSWKLGKFYWETEYCKINMNGRVFKNGGLSLNTYLQGSLRKVLDPLLKNMSIHEFIYLNANIKKKTKGEKVVLNGNMNYNTFTFGPQKFKNLTGNFRWDSKSKKSYIETHFEAGGIKSSVVIRKKGRVIRLKATNLPVIEAAKALKISGAVPLRGRVTEANIRIKGRDFAGTVNIVPSRGQVMPADKGSEPPKLIPALPKLEPALPKPQDNGISHKKTGAAITIPQQNSFDAEGVIDFTFNSKTKDATFNATKLKTDFGKLAFIKGIVTPKKRTRLQVQFRADAKKLQLLDKYTRYYMNLPLKRWKLAGGTSTIDLKLKRINKDLYIESDVHMRNFTSSGQHIRSLKGHTSTKRNITEGAFVIDDPELTGEALFTHNKANKDLQINFNNTKGEGSKALKLLDIDVSLKGPFEGDFIYQDKTTTPIPVVTGTFYSPHVNFYDFSFNDLKGELDYSDAVRLNKLTYGYLTGTGNADIMVNYGTKTFDIRGKIDTIDLHRMNNEFVGKADLLFSGSGAFDKDPINFWYNTGPINFFSDRSFKMGGEGTVLTDFSDFRLKTAGRIFDGDVESPFNMRLNQEGGRFTGGFDANIRDINMLIPWGNNRGEMSIKGSLKGPGGDQLSAEGYAEFKGEVLSFPNFPHALENFSGDFIFNDLNFTLRSFQGTLGGGAVQGNGYLSVIDNKLDSLFINFTGKEGTIHLMDRTTFTLDADLTIRYVKEKHRLLLSGEMNIKSGLWEREVDEGISFNTTSSLSPSGSTIMDMLDFDLKMVGNDNIRINNAFGEATGKFNLRLTGNTDFPVILGFIESKEGKINFSGKKFDLIKAKLTFNDKFQNDPQMKIESEAFIKNYRIKFNINGSTSRPNPELQSSPALPSRDILSLISVGELFRRPTSTELSTQIGTGTTGLIATELLDQLKKRTKKIFGNYLLRFEPNFSNITGNSIEDSSRIIVGKEIAKDFLIVYSTNFSTQRQQVVYLQYQITPTISLIGMRDEKNQLSIDLRFRKRQ